MEENSSIKYSKTCPYRRNDTIKCRLTERKLIISAVPGMKNFTSKKKEEINSNCILVRPLHKTKSFFVIPINEVRYEIILRGKQIIKRYQIEALYKKLREISEI